jgi:hypothetical protein
MFCADCRTMNDDASRFCIKCGAKAGSATMLRSPIEEARQMIQVSALLCYLIAALHIYELLVAAGGTLRSAAAIGAAACAVLAWMLWSSNSFAAGIVVFAILGLESFGLLAALAAEFARTHDRSNTANLGYLVMLAAGEFAAGCSTLRATIRMKRFAAKSTFS